MNRTTAEERSRVKKEIIQPPEEGRLLNFVDRLIDDYEDALKRIAALENICKMVTAYRSEQAPDGYDDPHKGFVECDTTWQDGVEWGWNQLGLKIELDLKALAKEAQDEH